MITWVRIKAAILSQPMTVKANTMVQKLAEAQISISLAFLCAAINMTIGVIVGAIWGFSKKVDAFMMVVSGRTPGIRNASRNTGER